MASHNDLGKLGEDLASNYLQEQGYQILHRNWRWQKSEIDIIAKDQQTIVCVEVKTRKDQPLVAPEESIDTKKIKLLLEGMNHFMESYPQELSVRFDIITVLIKGNSSEITHTKEGFSYF